MIQTQDLRISRLNFARVRFENFSEMFFCFYEEDNRLSDKDIHLLYPQDWGLSFSLLAATIHRCAPTTISSEKRPVVGKIITFTRFISPVLPFHLSCNKMFAPLDVIHYLFWHKPICEIVTSWWHFENSPFLWTFIHHPYSYVWFITIYK